MNLDPPVPQWNNLYPPAAEPSRGRLRMTEKERNELMPTDSRRRVGSENVREKEIRGT